MDPAPRPVAPRPRSAAPSRRDAPAARPRLTAAGAAPGAEAPTGASRSASPSGAGLGAWSRGDEASSTSLGRSLLGHVIGDKYGVTAIIGEGGMGAVYEAEHLQIGRLVAVKVMHARETQQREAIARLEHEARIAGRIGHPNICEVYDIGRLPDGSPYLVMERLHGETLAQRIERCGVVPPGELIDIMLQVLSALVTAHERGIVHRDLKPENIFLSERAGMLPVAKLLDFGISQASGVDGAAMNLTRTGMVMGTPYYMAPEQARGEVELDHRLDLWAVGVILYEALTGQRPFVAHNYNALLLKILTLWHRPVTELDPSIPPGLSRLVDRALAKEREERFQSAREFQEALRRFRNQASAPRRRAPERLAVQSIVEDRSDDGTMMFARLAGDRGAGDPGQVVVARGRTPSEPVRQGPRTSTSRGIQLRHSVWSSRALETATGGGSVRRRSEPAPDMSVRRRSEPAPDMSSRRRSEPAPDMAARRRSEPAPDMSVRRRSEPAPDMSSRRRSEPAPEMRDGQRDEEMEDRPTIPSLHPLARAMDLSDDAEATLVDPTPFPEDMTTLIWAEGGARDGDPS